ncbi:hypothetical protein GH890_32445 [Bacillus thuringiensis]|nr:hypothetical protein [Bacillus thuringiensis]
MIYIIYGKCSYFGYDFYFLIDFLGVDGFCDYWWIFCSYSGDVNGFIGSYEFGYVDGGLFSYR